MKYLLIEVPDEYEGVAINRLRDEGLPHRLAQVTDLAVDHPLAADRLTTAVGRLS